MRLRLVVVITFLVYTVDSTLKALERFSCLLSTLTHPPDCSLSERQIIIVLLVQLKITVFSDDRSMKVKICVKTPSWRHEYY